MPVAAALRRVVVMLAAAGLAAAVAGWVWAVVADEGFRSRFALSLMVVAGLLALVGGTLAPRLATAEARAFLGQGPGQEESGGDEPLTALGVFLFVALPLFAVGLITYGSG
ncbi:hypothetical protein [Blastococcus sp. SYSU DS0828]